MHGNTGKSFRTRFWQAGSWVVLVATLGCRDRHSSKHPDDAAPVVPRSTPPAQPQSPDSAQPVDPLPHPSDPLSARELERTVEIVRTTQHLGNEHVFSLVTLQEPSKETLDQFRAGDAVQRQAFVVVYDYAQNKTYEGIVDLGQGQMRVWRHVPGVQPAVGPFDYDIAETLVPKDERWQAALRKRGVTNPEHVYIDTWAMGPSANPALRSHRLVKTLAFYKGDTIYPYGRPIEGLIATVDITTHSVVEVIDRAPVPISPDVAGYDEHSVGPLRPHPRPVEIRQPLGVNYTLRGNEVHWQNWTFRVDVHPREGPVLHTVSYNDQGRERKILHRLSLSEMVVPYGDPDDTWSWRSAFDVGEYGFGRRASPLERGTDVPQNATLLNGSFVNDQGKVYEIPGALAIYELDGGVLWKHYDSLQRNEVRRGTDLVVSFNTAVGNYDYVLNYIFRQDGSLEVRIDLTGIMLAKGVASPPVDHAHDEDTGRDLEKNGHRVSANVVATHHQHFFNFRIDFDVDGWSNRVMELNTYPLPTGPDNPAGNAFTMRAEPLRSEREAQRDMSMEHARKWIVVHSNQTDATSERPDLPRAAPFSVPHGHPTGYSLLPGENTVPFASPGNISRRRAGFINHHFWVTQYNPQELNAAGPYPNQSLDGNGLPHWIQDNQPLQDQDLVVWYTMGVTHTPRPEEWPIMPAAHASFRIVPTGFFSRNPALDLPATSGTSAR